MTLICRVVEFINKIINEEKLPFDRADAEITTEGGRADIILWAERKIKPVLLFEIENSKDELEEFFEEVKKKAQFSKAPYFALWNIRQFRLWETPFFAEEREFYDSVYSEAGFNYVMDFEDVMDSHENAIYDFLKRILVKFFKRQGC